MMRFEVEEAAFRRPSSMIRFVLVTEDGEPLDPVAFIAEEDTWNLGDTFPFGAYGTLRIVEVRTEIAVELVEAGFSGVLVVEPSERP